MGASTYYISSLYSNCNFTGIDFIQELAELGNDFIGTQNKNMSFIQDDWFNLRKYNNIDGVISLQT